jgi:hypothetical protein
MPDRTDEILERLARIETLLGERCTNHQRQLDDHQRSIDGLRKRNGKGDSPSIWSDPKVIATIAVALAGIVSGVLAFFGVKV